MEDPSGVRDLINWTKLPKFYPSLTNPIAVEIQDKNIWCFVNHHMVGSVSAPNPVEGRIGFYLTEFAMRSSFADLKITQLKR